MKAVSKRRPADYVEPRLSDARIERMWSGIRSGKPAASHRSRWWLVAVAALLIGCVAILVAQPWSTQPESALARAEPASKRSDVWLATGISGKTHRFADGSQVDLAPATQVRVDHAGTKDIQLRLERGRINVRVPAVAGRQVVVAAGPAEMLTDAGHLEVELEMRPDSGPSLRVAVEAGRVDVRSADGGQHLAALGSGQTWTNAKLSDDVPVQKTPGPATVATAPSAPSATVPAVPVPAPSANASKPAELLAAAQRHRRSGDPAAAADAYERLRREHPSDARAGLAAFELARIRLDQLGDARGALRAFDAALASGKGGFFVEDAAAGRVRALSKLGDMSRCEKARKAFLKAHAKSPHTAAVRGLCKPR